MLPGAVPLMVIYTNRVRTRLIGFIILINIARERRAFLNSFVKCQQMVAISLILISWHVRARKRIGYKTPYEGTDTMRNIETDFSAVQTMIVEPNGLLDLQTPVFIRWRCNFVLMKSERFGLLLLHTNQIFRRYFSLIIK